MPISIPIQVDGVKTKWVEFVKRDSSILKKKHTFPSVLIYLGQNLSKIVSRILWEIGLIYHFCRIKYCFGIMFLFVPKGNANNGDWNPFLGYNRNNSWMPYNVPIPAMINYDSNGNKIDQPSGKPWMPANLNYDANGNQINQQPPNKPWRPTYINYDQNGNQIQPNNGNSWWRPANINYDSNGNQITNTHNGNSWLPASQYNDGSWMPYVQNNWGSWMPYVQQMVDNGWMPYNDQNMIGSHRKDNSCKRKSN